jgi:hypothetical protein
MYLIKIQQRLTHYQFIYGVKTPTGTERVELPIDILAYHYSFHYPFILWFVVWTFSLPYHQSDLGTSRQVSTPSSCDAWLGIVLVKRL